MPTSLVRYLVSKAFLLLFAIFVCVRVLIKLPVFLLIACLWLASMTFLVWSAITFLFFVFVNDAHTGRMCIESFVIGACCFAVWVLVLSLYADAKVALNRLTQPRRTADASYLVGRRDRPVLRL